MALDWNKCLFLDFEARSELDIREVGARAYAEHPSTELLCCGWVVGLDAEVELWRPGETVPPAVRDGDIWVAHNKDTERFLLQYKLGLVIPAEWWIDSATYASAAGMPRNLHDVGQSLHLPVQKESKGAMLALAKPRKLTKTNKEKWWTRAERPDLYAELEAYCRADVDVMRKACARLPKYEWVLPPREQQLAGLNDRMNDRGIPLDLTSVALAQTVVEAHGAELRAEFATYYPGVNPRHAPSVSKALGMENSRKETVRDELKYDQGTDRHKALTALKTIKTSSTAKLNAMLRHACEDGRAHGAMVFHGAGRTGRWSSMGIQVHNFVRGLSSGTPDWPAIDTSENATEDFFDALNRGLVGCLYSDPTRAVAAAMKGFIHEPDGLLSGDLSQIEARVLVSWAGQMDMVEAFRNKADPYKIMATRVYNVPLEAVTKDQRFMGKQGVLSCGYGVGKYGFKNALKVNFDIEVSLEEADRIVQAYRTASPRVKALWYDMDALAKQVLLERPTHLIQSTKVPRIAMRMVDDWMVMRLPSGRCLWYFEPELVPKDGGGWEIMYWGRDVTRGGMWTRVKTYGGKLVENATQAIARDVMAECLLRLDAAGFPVIMQVHDSAVAPGPAERLDEFARLFKQAPAWWPDLPLDAEVEHIRRYQ